MRARPTSRMLPTRPSLRTLVLLAIVLDVPGLARLVRFLTDDPTTETVVIAEVPVEIVRPSRPRAYPAFHFVTGAHPERRREPIVRRVAEGLARAGFVAVVPDLPGLGEGELTPRTFSAAAAVTRTVSARTDVRQGRVAMAGASAGAGIALVVAAEEDLASKVSMVAAVVPFADVIGLVRLATTATYGPGGSGVTYAVSPLIRRVVARSLVAALPDGHDRDRLRTALSSLADDVDACEHLGQAAGELELGPGAKAVVELLGNRDPNAFDAHLARVPETTSELIRGLSPALVAAAVRAPVEVVAPPDDPYFPLPEAAAIARDAPRGRLTVTRVLDHTRPSLNLSQVRDFARFLGWLHRCVAGAAS